MPTENDQFLATMGSPAREAFVTARERNKEESACPMVLLPPEIQNKIMSFLSTQKSISCLGKSCRSWYGPATQELYARDAKEHTSFAIKWIAAHAVDDRTTDSALRTLEISRRWGGQIDAIKPHLSRSDEARSDDEDETMYDTSTALHFAVFLGNVRLTKTLLDMKASLTIACSPLLWTTMGSEEFLERVGYFKYVFSNVHFGPAFPIFLTFLKSDLDMCKLLLEHGAGREAMIIHSDTGDKIMPILHFAAADRTTDYRQWQCLFDGFREYINEPCPRESRSTPLHIALKNACTQGMQIAVETGADKESRDGDLFTPLSLGIRELLYCTIPDPKLFEEHTRCFRKLVDLGGNVDPEGDSLIGLVVKHYVLFPAQSPGIRSLIYFLLEHHADVNRTILEPNKSIVNSIIGGIFDDDEDEDDDPPSLGLLQELLIDLVERGLNLSIPAPGFPSPLYRVLHLCNSETEWLFDLLFEKGAMIHEDEVDSAFLCWCQTPRLWKDNKYDAWWQHQGQEDEIFQKWCEHPYNAWWWQHVKHISPFMISMAYKEAFDERRQLYDILTHLPLPRPSYRSS